MSKYEVVHFDLSSSLQDGIIHGGLDFKGVLADELGNDQDTSTPMAIIFKGALMCELCDRTVHLALLARDWADQLTNGHRLFAVR